MIGGVIIPCLSKTHKASLNAILLRSLQTTVLDLVLRFLCNVFDTLIAEKQVEIEQISKR
jgi:hypothetical protein